MRSRGLVGVDRKHLRRRKFSGGQLGIWLALAVLLCSGVLDGSEVAAARASFSAAADLPTTGTPLPQFAAVDSAVTAMMAKYQIPGAALGVVHDGRLVYLRGYGFSDTQAGTPVQLDSRFRIASISKPLTAAAALILVDQGKLSLDTPAFSLLSGLTPLPGASVDPRIASITVRELINHQGGWDRSASFDPMFRARDAALALGVNAPADCPTIIRWMLGFPLDFSPGTKTVYSNFGYCVLGQVIAHVTGMPYGQYVQQAILDPLAMSSTQLGQTLSSLPGEVHYYDFPGARLATSVFDGTSQVPAPYGGFSLEALDAHGGWVSTTSDLLRLLTNLNGTRGAPLLTRTFAGYGLNFGEIPPTGSGWSWNFEGSLPGTRTILAMDGNNGWALLTNTWRSDTDFDQTDPLWNDMRSAIAAISSWPDGDLFTSGSGGGGGGGSGTPPAKHAINGDSKANKITGTAGADLIKAGAGNDTVHGRAGNDTIYGGTGADAIYGDAGNDVLYGGPGADKIFGGAANDIIYAVDGTKDTIDCGTGHDVVYTDEADVVARNCEVVHRSK